MYQTAQVRASKSVGLALSARISSGGLAKRLQSTIRLALVFAGYCRCASFLGFASRIANFFEPAGMMPYYALIISGAQRD